MSWHSIRRNRGGISTLSTQSLFCINSFNSKSFLSVKRVSVVYHRLYPKFRSRRTYVLKSIVGWHCRPLLRTGGGREINVTSTTTNGSRPTTGKKVRLSIGLVWTGLKSDEISLSFCVSLIRFCVPLWSCGNRRVVTPRRTIFPLPDFLEPVVSIGQIRSQKGRHHPSKTMDGGSQPPFLSHFLDTYFGNRVTESLLSVRCL